MARAKTRPRQPSSERRQPHAPRVSIFSSKSLDELPFEPVCVEEVPAKLRLPVGQLQRPAPLTIFNDSPELALPRPSEQLLAGVRRSLRHANSSMELQRRTWPTPVHLVRNCRLMAVLSTRRRSQRLFRSFSPDCRCRRWKSMAEREGAPVTSERLQSTVDRPGLANASNGGPSRFSGPNFGQQRDPFLGLGTVSALVRRLDVERTANPNEALDELSIEQCMRRATNGGSSLPTLR